MITKPIKIMLYLVLAIILVIMAMVVYRMFFMFSKEKVNAAIKAESESYADAGAAANLLREMCEYIKRSQDLTSIVCQTAKADKAEKETVLVRQAAMMLYGSGALQNPNTVTSTSNG
jgi:flagellar basal body-associated protein FliL